MAWKVEQAGARAGTYVTDLDLPKPSADEEILDLRRALLGHPVKALPSQRMSLGDPERLTDRHGGCDITPFVMPIEGRSFLIRISKGAHGTLNFANAWHTDCLNCAAPDRSP